MRVPQSRTFWEGEAEFCEQHDFPALLGLSNVKGYCRMQANFCWKDGYQDLAERIAKAGGLTIDEESNRQWLEELERAA